MFAHLYHAAPVAKHGGIFTLAGALIGFALGWPWIVDHHSCSGVFSSLSCTTYKNIFGLTGYTTEEFFLPMLLSGAVCGFVGFLIGKGVVKLGWMSEDEINPE